MEPTVFLDISSANLRIALRIAFTFLFLLIGFFGDQCGAAYVQLKLLNRRHAKVGEMTGWVREGTLGRYFAATGQLPAGPLGWLMIFAIIFSPLSDLLVSKLVVDIDIASRCPFGVGLVIPRTVNGGKTWSDPMSIGGPTLVASQAQVISANNGGLKGIYWKANWASNFAADNQDYVGSWACQNASNDITFPANTAPEDIMSSLVTQNILYSDSYNFCDIQHSDHTNSTIFIWSTTSDGSEGELWDVRAAVQTTANGTDPKIMRTFSCKMDALDVEWVLKKINGAETMDSWCSAFQGYLFNGTATPASVNSDAIIAQLLNTIVMVSGGDNIAVNPPETGDDTQGCLVTRAAFPLIVILVFVLTGTVAIGLAVFWGFLQIAIRQRLSSTNEDEVNEEDVLEETPNSLLNWMVLAVREAQNGAGVKPGDLKNVKFGRDANTKRLKILTGGTPELDIRDPEGQAMMGVKG